MSGTSSPEEPLSERKRADALEIGRTPVREAMRDLVRDGLLEVSPARGTYLRSFTTQEVRELYEVRQGLEGLAAQRGATPEPKTYGPIFRHTLEHPDDHDPDDVDGTGARFHLDLCGAAGNQQLLNIYQPLRLPFQWALALPRHFDHAIWEHLTKGLDVRTRIVTEMAESHRPQPKAGRQR